MVEESPLVWPVWYSGYCFVVMDVQTVYSLFFITH
jgi:hypothetical protein